MSVIYTASVTAQNQLTIPVFLSNKLNLKRRKVIIEEKDGGLFIEPVKDFLELRGSLKTNKKPLSNKELDDKIAEAVAEDYRKKLKQWNQ